MRIAIPVFGSKISPRFDCAGHMLMVEVTDGSVAGRWMEAIEPFRWRQQLNALKEKGVEVMLCGGIRRCDHFQLISIGVRVHAGLVGEVDDILAAFLRGEIAAGTMVKNTKRKHARRRRGSGSR
jgi:predicted Fe-Mo cluster-binding NifX family protein